MEMAVAILDFRFWILRLRSGQILDFRFNSLSTIYHSPFSLADG
jgi:hypothetical protein